MQMLDTMRKPIFVVALIAVLLAVLVELASIALVTQHVTSSAASLDVPTTGKAIPALALLDGLLLFATTIIGIGILIPERVQSKVQGIVTLVFSILLLISIIVVLLRDLVQLVLMVSLLMAPIFGTIAYFAIWSSFDTGTARAALGLIMTLKIIFAVCLVVSQQRFLQNKGLVLIIITSVLSNLLIAFLYGLVPGVFVSIADVVAALVICVLAIVWAVVYLIGGVVSVVKVIV
jgi:hypothetical protein